MRVKTSVFDLLLGVAALFLATSSALAQDVVTYYHADAVGSPIAATDANGNLLWREDYSPYGEKLRQEISPRTNRMWFTGHHHDDDSGLTYAGARHYDPMIGRFMSVDPVAPNAEHQFSFNRYAYGNNNPFKYIDPDGREVVLATHEVPSFRGWNHAKIIIIPDNQEKYMNDERFNKNVLPDKRIFATLGAGAGDYPKHRTLVSDVNRENDVKFTKEGKNTSRQVLRIPGKDDDAAIAELFDADSRYRDNEKYDGSQVLGSWSSGYNSNGYAHGLLISAGFKNFSEPPATRGWKNPVPIPQKKEK